MSYYRESSITYFPFCMEVTINCYPAIMWPFFILNVVGGGGVEYNLIFSLLVSGLKEVT
jgi:hypothetical protein